MHKYQELERAYTDMQAQSALYKPTSFWEEASSKIAEEIRVHGVEVFRSLPMPRSFFVPTYGVPGGGFSQEQVDGLSCWLQNEFPQSGKAQLALGQFLKGESAALADYRVLLAADDPLRLPYLHLFSESNAGSPVEQFAFGGRNFSRSSLNYLLGMALLKKHLGEDLPRTVLEIGGGFGTLGEILAASGVNDLRYIDIDIPPTSFIAQYYLGKVLGKDNVATYVDTRDSAAIEIAGLPKASALCTWQLEKLQGRIDLFVNFISFQEMEPHVVQNYLQHVTRLETRWIMLRNMREGKQLKKNGSVGVEKAILGNDYLEMLPDYELVERNVFPYGCRTVDDFHSEILLLKRKQAA